MTVQYKFVDCQGFAGGFSVGATLAGMKLVGKLENVGGFGVPLMEANREFLGNDWQSQVGDPSTWETVKADVVLGTPPCSGFSSMTAGYKHAHGINAPINSCMWDLVRYAAKVRPVIMAMESVSQAFTKGLPLMRDLTRELRDLTGIHYFATHVMQNNLSTGGCTVRKRYFLVLSQVPFGVERCDLGDELPVLGDALADLRSLDQTWDPQPYADETTEWSRELRSSNGLVDGHIGPQDKSVARSAQLINGDKSVSWHPGESQMDVLRRYHETHGELPESWQYQSGTDKTKTRAQQLIDKNFEAGGFAMLRYWPWDKPGRVMSGAGPYMLWHPNGRYATQRECARILGFPDDWVVGTAKNDRNLSAFWGKGTSISPAKWLMQWVRRSMDGNPGSYTGEVLDEGDKLIDVSSDWRPIWKKQLQRYEADGSAPYANMRPQQLQTV